MTRQTDGGKGDRIPGADQAAYEAGYENIVWGARDVQEVQGTQGSPVAQGTSDQEQANAP